MEMNTGEERSVAHASPIGTGAQDSDMIVELDTSPPVAPANVENDAGASSSWALMPFPLASRITVARLKSWSLAQTQASRASLKG